MKFIIRALMLGALLSFNSVAQEVMLDRVAVIVDQGVILESEIDALVKELNATLKPIISNCLQIVRFVLRLLSV